MENQNSQTDNIKENSEVENLKLENEKLKLENEKLKQESSEWWNQRWLDSSINTKAYSKLWNENQELERKHVNQVNLWNGLVREIHDLKETFNRLSMITIVQT